MSELNQEPPADNSSPENVSMLQSILRSGTGLALFAVLTAGLIALTQQQTADRIDKEVRKARAKALYQIAPENSHDNDLLASGFGIDSPQLGLSSMRQAYIAKQGDKPVTLLLPVRANDGYTGPINLIVGIDVRNDSISGVRVTQHKETPGLGDKIETRKSDWILQFEGRSLGNTDEQGWQVQKDGGDFDQLTGATITPRAIVRAVHNALLFYRAHRDTLLAQAPGTDFLTQQLKETN